LALLARHPAAVVPFDCGGDGAASVPRADGYAPRAETDSEIAISPIAPLSAVAIDPIIPVATHLHINANLCHFEVFRLGGNAPNKQRSDRDNSRYGCYGKSDPLHGYTSLG
jgi:hypothetical protein